MHLCRWGPVLPSRLGSPWSFSQPRLSHTPSPFPSSGPSKGLRTPWNLTAALLGGGPPVGGKGILQLRGTRGDPPGFWTSWQPAGGNSASCAGLEGAFVRLFSERSTCGKTQSVGYKGTAATASAATASNSSGGRCSRYSTTAFGSDSSGEKCRGIA